MEIFLDYAPNMLALLWFVLFGIVIFRIMRWINTLIKNNDLYKEDMLTILEEIRDELKELNKNNLVFCFFDENEKFLTGIKLDND